MNKNASPGPDGFGPGFYRKFWHILKEKIRNFFADFHALRSDLSCPPYKRVVILPVTKEVDKSATTCFAAATAVVIV